MGKDNFCSQWNNPFQMEMRPKLQNYNNDFLKKNSDNQRDWAQDRKMYLVTQTFGFFSPNALSQFQLNVAQIIFEEIEF